VGALLHKTESFIKFTRTQKFQVLHTSYWPSSVYTRATHKTYNKHGANISFIIYFKLHA